MPSGLEGSFIAAIDANTAWAVMWDRSGTTSGGVFKTTNAGLGWTRDTTLFAGSGAWAKGIHFFDSNNGVAFGNPRGGFWEIYTTTDGGAHWIRVPSANIPPVQDLGSSDFSLTGAFATIGNTLWFGTFLLRSVYKTTDRGMTWSAARNVLGPDGGGVLVAFKDALNGLACSPFNDTGGNRIYRTTDGGETWTSLAPGSIPATPSANFIAYNPGSHVYVIASHHSNDYYVGRTISGSAYSTDDGSSWKQTDSLPHGPLTFTSSGVGWSDGSNDTVYKWDSKLLVGSVRQSKGIAEGFRLEQNYPNPFNPTTMVNYQLPMASNVRLVVYDILGREVAVLVNERKSAGSYSVRFDTRLPGGQAHGIASGVYFYRLTAGNVAETRKMILIR